MIISPAAIERQVHNAVVASILGLHCFPVSESRAVSEVLDGMISELAAKQLFEPNTIKAMVRGVTGAMQTASIDPRTAIQSYCDALSSNKVLIGRYYEQAARTSAREFLDSAEVLGHTGLRAFSESPLANYCNPLELELL